MTHRPGTGTRRQPSPGDEEHRELFDTILRFSRQLPDEIPEPVKKKIEETVSGEIRKLREWVLDARPPRILILGRRGCGKSSLVNAIFGEEVAEVGDVVARTSRGRWFRHQGSSGALDILDTRGLGDRTSPDGAEHADALDEVKAAIRRDDRIPDVILFLCKAKEVDAHVGEDVRGCARLQRFVQEEYQYRPPILALATQVDELAPLRVTEPPYDDGDKQRAISLACSTLRDAFDEEGLELLRTFPVSTYADFEDGELVYDRFWNVEPLVEYLVETLPRCSQLALARAARVRSVQRKLAGKLVRSTALVCSGVATAPIPVADTVPITGAQLVMVTGIGLLSGRDVSRETAKEFLAAMGVNVAAAFALRETARALVKLIPVAGQVINAGVAGSATWALGQAAILYFIEGGSPEEARARLKELSKRPWKALGEGDGSAETAAGTEDVEGERDTGEGRGSGERSAAAEGAPEPPTVPPPPPPAHAEGARERP